MKLNKTHIVLGVVSLVTVTGALLLYRQYQKLMNYCISMKSVKLKTISPIKVNFDMLLNFKNNSDIEFTINSQTYSVYLNGIFVTKVKGTQPAVIKPKSISTIPINVEFNPKEVMNNLGKNALDLATGLDKIKIKVDTNMTVSLYGIPVNIPYIYESTLKELTTPTPVNNSTENQKC